MNSPLTSPSHPMTTSPARAVDRVRASPSSRTPLVWVPVTVAPTSTASRIVPSRPAMYAAMIVLPCPGSRACDVPSSTASPTARRPTGQVRSRRPTRSSKRSCTRSRGSRGRAPIGQPEVVDRPVGGAVLRARPPDRAHGDRRLHDLGRRIEQLTGIAAEPVGDALLGDVRLGEVDPVAARHHLAPPDAIGLEAVSVVDHRAPLQRDLRPQRALEAAGVETGLAGAEAEGGPLDRERRAFAVDDDLLVLGHLGAACSGVGVGLVRAALAVAVEVDVGQRLGGGDLGDVDHRPDDDPVGADAELVEVVHREVAQRVGGHRARRQQHDQGRREGDGRRGRADGSSRAELGERLGRGPGVQGIEPRVELHGGRELGSGGVVVAESTLDHAGVEVEAGAAGAELQRRPRSPAGPPRSGRCGTAPRRGRRAARRTGELPRRPRRAGGPLWDRRCRPRTAPGRHRARRRWPRRAARPPRPRGTDPRRPRFVPATRARSRTARGRGGRGSRWTMSAHASRAVWV